MNRYDDWYFTGVPGLGTVVFSRQALAKLRAHRITDEEIAEVLLSGKDRLDNSVVAREYRDIRLVIRVRTYMKGAAAVCVAGLRTP